MGRQMKESRKMARRNQTGPGAPRRPRPAAQARAARRRASGSKNIDGWAIAAVAAAILGTALAIFI